MRPRPVTPLVAPLLASLLLTSLTACAPDAASPSAVPDGVSEQYTALDAEVADEGGSTTSGDWTVSYIVEAAEPWFAHEGRRDVFRPAAADETHHIEVIPRETATGRIVPDVPVTVAVVDASGDVVDEKTLNFYYSRFFHYANNFKVPDDGTYSLRVHLDEPTFFRHGEQGEEPALARGADVTFEDVELSRG